MTSSKSSGFPVAASRSPQHRTLKFNSTLIRSQFVFFIVWAMGRQAAEAVGEQQNRIGICIYVQRPNLWQQQEHCL